MKNGDIIEAIVIDPYAREIRKQLIRRSQIEDIIGAIGHGCKVFTGGGYLDNCDCLYVDDEGLFGHQSAAFMINDVPFMGRALVVGTDNEGGTIEPKSSGNEIGAMVKWGIH